MVWTTKSPDFAQLFWRLHGSRYVDALPDIDQQLENAIVAWLRSHGVEKCHVSSVFRSVKMRRGYGRPGMGQGLAIATCGSSDKSESETLL